MSLERFEEAQKHDYNLALYEITQGKKESHWMWYIFPQIKGLGFSPTADFYAIEDLQEAEEYLNHPILSTRLHRLCEALLALRTNDAMEIFGYPDNLKLKSSMTLFYCVAADRIFLQVLEKFYEGKLDEKTLEIIGKDRQKKDLS